MAEAALRNAQKIMTKLGRFFFILKYVYIKVIVMVYETVRRKKRIGDLSGDLPPVASLISYSFYSLDSKALT